MSYDAIIYGGALIVMVSVALMVGGARTQGKAGPRTAAITVGFLLLVLGLCIMMFGLPMAISPVTLPVSMVVALILGWAIGYGWGNRRRPV